MGIILRLSISVEFAQVLSIAVGGITLGLSVAVEVVQVLSIVVEGALQLSREHKSLSVDSSYAANHGDP